MSQRKFIANVTKYKKTGRIEIIFHGIDPEPAKCAIEEVIKTGAEFWFADAKIEVWEMENGKRLRVPEKKLRPYRIKSQAQTFPPTTTPPNPPTGQF